jgi:hypothetical protein
MGCDPPGEGGGMSDDRIDASCADCAFMHRDRDGGRWCSSPQLLRAMGHSQRCVWERDGVRDQSRAGDTAKCGREAVNFKRRGFV